MKLGNVVSKGEKEWIWLLIGRFSVSAVFYTRGIHVMSFCLFYPRGISPFLPEEIPLLFVFVNLTRICLSFPALFRSRSVIKTLHIGT